jgi:NAD dependent epimerase/dehydratase family enzyme
MSVKKILITGGSGLIGRRLSASLLKQGHSVSHLSRNSSSINDNSNISVSSSLFCEDLIDSLLINRNIDILFSHFYPQLQVFNWNIDKQTIDKDALRNVDTIVHLTGANLNAKRWTNEYKNEIIKSRVESANLLFKEIEKMNEKERPEAFISASAM